MEFPPRHYAVSIDWTGNRGTGTSAPRAYSREHTVRAEGVPDLLGSADPAFRGDADRWNPELLLLAAVAQCHMMSYFYVATQHGVVVTAYRDDATASLRVHPDGSGEITEATVRPEVTLADETQRELADTLHAKAHDMCFIARSVAFPVRREPRSPQRHDSRVDSDSEMPRTPASVPNAGPGARASPFWR